MKKIYFLFFGWLFLALTNCCLFGQDVKVKLNSADGSTSFQVRDVNDVVVSSITSDGSIITRYGVRAATANFTAVGINVYSLTTSSGIKVNSGAVDIPAGAIKDRTIQNEDLLVVSTYTYSTSWYDAPNTTADTDIVDMYGTLAVSSAPATIFVFGHVTSNGKAGKVFTFKALVGGVLVAQSRIKPDATDTTDFNGTVALIGAYRVTEPGNYVVKFQYTTDDATQDIWIGERSITAFLLGSP